MGHKPQPQFVDRDGAVEQQAAVNLEALNRAKLRNNPAAPESSADDGIDIAAGIAPRGGTKDATLNWGGGEQVATIGRSDIAFSAELSRISGVGARTITPVSMDPFVAHPGRNK